MNTAVLAQYLFIAGTLPFMALGVLHWLLTFREMRKPGGKLAPRDEVTRISMQASAMNIHPRANMWKAWVGFNHSHSLGAVTFGMIFFVLAVQDFGALIENPTLMRIAAVVPLIYLWIGVRFWFRTPIIGISLGAACFIAAFLLTL